MEPECTIDLTWLRRCLILNEKGETLHLSMERIIREEIGLLCRILPVRTSSDLLNKVIVVIFVLLRKFRVINVVQIVIQNSQFHWN